MSLRNLNSAVTTSWFRFGRPTYPIGETEKELLPPAEGTPRPLPVAPSQRGEFTAMTPGATAEEQKPSHRLPRRQSPESKVPFLSRFSWACWELGPFGAWLGWLLSRLQNSISIAHPGSPSLASHGPPRAVHNTACTSPWVLAGFWPASGLQSIMLLNSPAEELKPHKISQLIWITG